MNGLVVELELGQGHREEDLNGGMEWGGIPGRERSTEVRIHMH